MPQSEIYKKIATDLVSAMKEKNEVVVRVLRFMKSQLDNEQIEKKGEFSDQDALKVLRKRLKQAEDAKDKFQAGNRADLVKKEEEEIVIIKQYLPAQLGEAEIEKLTDKIIGEIGAESMKDFGRAMGALVKAVGGRADGKVIKTILEKKLK